MKRVIRFSAVGILLATIAVAWLAVPTRPDTPASARTETDNSNETESQPKIVLSAGTDPPSKSTYQPDKVTHTQVVVPFLTTHCLECHGPEVQKAGFRVDNDLPNDFRKRSVVAKWSEVLNMLNSDEMPPKGEPRPSAKDAQQIVEWIEKERIRAERSSIATTKVLRRLNREEYSNTIRDLFGMDFKLADEFPAEPTAGGFDNNGSALAISPLHMELYLKMAKKILERALVSATQRPKSIKWRFEFEKDTKRTDHNRIYLDENNQRVMLTRSTNPDRDGLVFVRYWGVGCRIGYFKVPHEGNYSIRIRAAGIVPAKNDVAVAGPKILFDHQLKRESNIAHAAGKKRSREGYEKWGRPSHLKHFSTDRSYRYGYPRLKLSNYVGAQKRILMEKDIEAPLSAPKIYDVQAWFKPETAGLTLTNEYHIPYTHINNWVRRHEAFPRPELAIDWVEIEGPMYDDWPPTSYKRVFIDSPNKDKNELAYAEDVLTNFMTRAYRRPLRSGEAKPFVNLFQTVRDKKPTFVEAMKVPLSAILISPDFLYLVEGDESNHSSVGKLNDFELASRLSYFLWSSMPDESLLDLAKAGKLNDPQTLRTQVDRMLADKRAEALVKNFAGQWLRLREVGANPPVESLYHRYDKHLEMSMRGETEAFFEHILRNDRSVLDFLRCDYVVINERLARYYDIPGVKGDHFRPVKVPAGVKRGGLLTQASILSVTSNGTRTSPVWRGVWILERLLGDPPAPPPPNAGDIPPAEPGQHKLTIRQRLLNHRSNPQCARCHNKIDPLGFALENFNAAGEWRDRETPGQNPPPIDATAKMPDGTEFVGVTGLQDELLKRKEAFLRCLTKKLYTYALARELGYADEPTITTAVETMSAHDYTLRSLIHHIVTSELFRTK